MSVRPARFPALDVLRGLVMVLMTVDHASETMNHGRVFTDSFAQWLHVSKYPPSITFATLELGIASLPSPASSS